MIDLLFIQNIFKLLKEKIVSKLYFTRLTAKEPTHDSKYVIYTCGGKSAVRGSKSADRYRYRNSHIVTKIELQT